MASVGQEVGVVEATVGIVEAMDLPVVPEASDDLGYFFKAHYGTLLFQSSPDFGSSTSPGWHESFVLDVLDKTMPLRIELYGALNDGASFVGGLHVDLAQQEDTDMWLRLAPSGQVHVRLRFTKRSVPRISAEEVAILAVMGKGAYGQVHKGFFDGQVVAIKTMHVTNPTAFAAELLQVQALKSPYIVPIYGVMDGPSTHPKVVAEHVEAGSLAQLLTLGRLQHYNKLQLAADVASGVAYLHERSIVHGELRPSNVFVTSDGRAQLSDIHFPSAQLVHFDTALSYPWPYAAPEILLGAQVHKAGDVYAVGVLLVALNTESVPFAVHRGNPFPAIHRVLHDGDRPLCRADCDAWYADIATACMATDVDARPPAADVAAQLSAALPVVTPVPVIDGIGDAKWYCPRPGAMPLVGDVGRFTAGVGVQIAVLPAATFSKSRRLGAGPYGYVEAFKYGDTTVAVKTYVGHPTEFEQAVTTMALFVDVPSIVRLLGVVQVDTPRPQMVMEYMDLGALRRYLDIERRGRRNRITVHKIDVAHAVATALGHVHARNIVHRNVNSLSVLLNERREVKLTNFILARSVENPPLTQGAGTMFWMAPEVIVGGVYSVAADIYSFGVLLTELDTLEPPFGALRQSHFITLDEVSRAVRRPEVRPNCESWYRDIAERCMAQDPSARPTAAELVELFAAQRPTSSSRFQPSRKRREAST
ncbi:serine/threonineprotein kinase [Achlya hypogyna]|uniref:Serine/threonineprotein kinase n=1 Tax=Achlya hypogyna TaxID=1202772 RepID=A0A1V9ZIZ3_ACHHY|nr:serine/threonineprotein kinase [Achlya hypogyna]